LSAREAWHVGRASSCFCLPCPRPAPPCGAALRRLRAREGDAARGPGCAARQRPPPRRGPSTDRGGTRERLDRGLRSIGLLLVGLRPDDGRLWALRLRTDARLERG